MISITTTSIEIELQSINNRIIASQTKQEMIKEAKERVEVLTNELLLYKKAKEMATISRKEANKYLTLKQQTMIDSINKTLIAINKLINSNTELTLEMGENSISIKNQLGTEIIDSEGAGYSSIVATQIKVLALWNSLYSKLCILDEPIAQANRKNTEYFVDFLKEMSKEMQIIFISQDSLDYLSDKADLMLEVYRDDEESASKIRIH